MSGTVLEIQAGAAAPVGCTTFHHNGKQYAFTDGVWTGSTFIPSMPMVPTPPPTAMVDFSGVYKHLSALGEMIGELDTELNSVKGGIGELTKKLDLLFDAGPAIEAVEERWREQMTTIEDRFDAVDQALRLVLDE